MVGEKHRTVAKIGTTDTVYQIINKLKATHEKRGKTLTYCKQLTKVVLLSAGGNALVVSIAHHSQ